jgi:hypothetical protein
MAEFNRCASLIKDEAKVSEILELLNKSQDPLQDMLNTQEWLQGVLADKLPENNIHPSNIETKGQLIEWVDRNFDAIMDEYRELKNSVGGMSKGEKEASAVWKKWKSNHNSISSERLTDMPDDDRMEMLMEMIDIWHFILNMFIGMGFKSEDIYLLYMLKNFENARRYKNNY